jgi:hypothetical protein
VIGHTLGRMVAIELGSRHLPVPRALVADDPAPVHPTEVARLLCTGFAEQLV